VASVAQTIEGLRAVFDDEQPVALRAGDDGRHVCASTVDVRDEDRPRLRSHSRRHCISVDGESIQVDVNWDADEAVVFQNGWHVWNVESGDEHLGSTWQV
jgi:hypothetical protein